MGPIETASAAIRAPGISFLVRVRNEEATLERSLKSLEDLRIPHTIHVILHRCRDGSEAIATRRMAVQPIEIAYDHVEISRPGYETLITPRDHKRSLVTYYRRCLGLATRAWVFKWDADFIATPELIAFMNDSHLFRPEHVEPTRIRLSACFDGLENREYYLSNCLFDYGKHVFWEVPVFDAASVSLDRSDLRIEHASSLSVLKRYWRRAPWFVDKPRFHRKYVRLVELVGPEPLGCARASNPECNRVFTRVMSLQDALRHEGILLFE